MFRFDFKFGKKAVEIILSICLSCSYYTVKTFGLLQPYFGCLSCMPDVCVTHYKFSRVATNLILNQTVVEKLLLLLN